MRPKNPLLALCLALAPLALWAQPERSGTLQQWHRITLTFEGPTSGEKAQPNPFTDYRMLVEFSQAGRTYRVPGYFAADGQAAETGATGGNRWRVHFAPDAPGTWTWRASFRTGPGIAISDDPSAGTPLAFDGQTGQFTVAPSDKSGRDHRAHGRLEYVDGHHLRFAGSGKYFIKLGANSPENLLAYEDIDNVTDYRGLRKSWSPHLTDWQAGDPSWRGGKGKGLIGALNYLAAEGQTSFSAMVFTVDGDDRNVYPFLSRRDEDFNRYDCSKLDQWEIILQHAEQLGLHVTLFLQEAENNHLLDNGALGPLRQLFYREMIARFGHHLALTWNTGEENTNSFAQQEAFAAYFAQHDPYRHPINIHTYVYKADDVYGNLLDKKANYAGPSLQATYSNTHRETLDWVERSQAAGHPWTVYADEQGPPQFGVPHDDFDGTPSLKQIRGNVLWGNLMAGGAGTDYYFGYNLPEDDLTCEDFRPRSRMWAFNRYALHFFHTYLPFHQMTNRNDLVGNTIQHNGAYCLAIPGSVYAVYRFRARNSTALQLDAATGSYTVKWYNPRTGGPLLDGTITRLDNVSGEVDLGMPPVLDEEDWVILVRSTDAACPPAGTACDDGDPATFNDVEDGNCNCVGTPCPPIGTACDDGDPATFNDVEDGNCNCVGTPIPPPPPPPAGQTEIWIEAECAEVTGSTWKEKESEEASYGLYLRVPPNTEFKSAPSTQRRHLVQFSFVAEASSVFRIYLRSITQGPNQDSYWFRVDDGPWALAVHPNGSYSKDLQWGLMDGMTFEDGSPIDWNLSAGQHTVTLSIYESNFWLDKIFITDGPRVPTGFGGLDPECGGVCPPAGTPCDDGDPMTTDDVEDGHCNCAGTPVEPPPPPVGSPEDLWVEAECAPVVGYSWKTHDDDDASNGLALRIPSSLNFLSSPATERRRSVYLDFEAPVAGSYTVYVRTITKGPYHDSFWFRLDDGPWAIWDEVNKGAYSKTYQWTPITGRWWSDQTPVSWALPAGPHRLTLSIREGDIWVDKFLITAGETVPQGLGGDAPCLAAATLAPAQPTLAPATMGLAAEGLRLYPNPARHQVQVEYQWPGGDPLAAGHLRLVDMLGRIWREAPLPDEERGQILLSLQDVPAGTYTLLLIRGENQLSQRLLVQP